MLHEDAGEHVIGRSPDVALFVDDERISRRHARITFADGWWIEDLESKNGLVVDGTTTARAVLDGTHWIDAGGVLLRFEVLDERTASRLAEDRESRWRISRAAQRELTADLPPRKILERLLDSTLRLADLERGFVLETKGGHPLEPEVVARRNLRPEDFSSPRFQGSVGAVERVLRERRPVATTDASLDTWLGERASVLTGGIRGLVCLPLLVDDDLLGVLYADSRRPGAAVSELDVEILSALADHAALVLSLAAVRRRLAALETENAAVEIVAARAPSGSARDRSWRRLVTVDEASP